MKVNELRLGNWVSNTHDIPMIVEAIYKDTVYVDFKGNVGGLWEFNKYEPFKPIKLTQEILLKCGFVAKNEYDYFCLNGIKISSTIMRCDTKERSCFYLYLGDENEILNNRIDYLHQLQNLYYSLTNEELEIQL